MVGYGLFEGGLDAVEFSAEVEEFSARHSLRESWNNEVSTCSLSMFCCLVRHNIPSHLDMLKANRWHENILRDMERMRLRAGKG